MTPYASFLIVLLATVYNINGVQSVKILGVFPMAAHSHFTIGFKLMKELADKGHQVTFINAYPQKKPIPNLKDVSLEGLVAIMNGKVLFLIIKDEFTITIHITLHFVYNKSSIVCY